MRMSTVCLLLILDLSAVSAFGEDGCKYDTQCKGDRICEKGVCTTPFIESLYPNTSTPAYRKVIKTTRIMCEMRGGEYEPLNNMEGKSLDPNNMNEEELTRCVLRPR